MIGVVMRIDEMRHLVADAVGGGDLVDGPLDVVTDGGRRVEQDDAVAGRQERGLVGPVRDPVEVPLDSPDVVALLVDAGPNAERGSAHSPEARRRSSGAQTPRSSARLRRARSIATLSTGVDRGASHRAFESLNSLVVTRASSSVMMLGEMSEGSPPVFSSGGQLFGREREREVLDRLLDGGRGESACWSCTAKRASARPRCSSTRSRLGAGSGSPGRPASRRRWSSRSRRFSSCVPRSSTFWTVSRSPSTRRSASRLDSVRGRRRIRSWSGWRSSACCPRRPRSGRSSLLLMTRIGWTTRRRGRLRSWLAACWRRRIVLLFADAPGRRRARRAYRSFTSQPLGHRDARALLESVLPARLDEPVLERIVVETRGNPLALLELPRGLTPTELAGGFGLPAAVPLSASIEESFTRRLASLPHDARRLLLVAAADPVGDPALVWRAAERLGIPESAADIVESEDLLVLGPRVVFRHPLVRSAVYRAAGPRRAARGPPRPRGGDRSGTRSGSPRLAPGAGGLEAR